MRSLADYQGQKVILYFYPKDMEGGKAVQKGIYAKMARGEMVRLHGRDPCGSSGADKDLQLERVSF